MSGESGKAIEDARRVELGEGRYSRSGEGSLVTAWERPSARLAAQ